MNRKGFAPIIILILGLGVVGLIAGFWYYSMNPVRPITDPVTSLILGTVQGKVLLSPTCPVEHIPPDPACAPKPYQADVEIYTPNIPPMLGFRIYKTISTDANGNFTFGVEAPLPIVLKVKSDKVYPRCTDVNLQVSPNVITTTTINCDTGIR